MQCILFVLLECRCIKLFVLLGKLIITVIIKTTSYGEFPLTPLLSLYTTIIMAAHNCNMATTNTIKILNLLFISYSSILPKVLRILRRQLSKSRLISLLKMIWRQEYIRYITCKEHSQISQNLYIRHFSKETCINKNVP